MKQNMKSILLSILILSFSILAFSQSKEKSDFVGEFYEWEGKTQNSKPDQIRVDPFNRNIVWFTLPPVHGVGRFDFTKKEYTEFKEKGRYRPDGLIIDKHGILWFGEQGTGTLGKFDPVTEEFEHFFAPYKGANLAIPTVDHDGNIWVVDHENNIINRFNPKEEKFTMFRLPTPKSWVTDVKADSKNRIWFSCYNSDRIGVIDADRKTITEYEVPEEGVGPAFMAIDSQDRIWFTMWISNKIGMFDPKSKKFSEYEFPMKNPGPSAMTIGKDDVIYFSTKYLNSIVKFDPKQEGHFTYFTIPTPKSGQKDGICVDDKNVIWLTEMGKNKIARLVIGKEDDLELPGKSYKNRTIQPGYRVKAKKTVTSAYSEKTTRVRLLRPIKD
ncbi:MAG: hypothetical protein OEZ36_06470 [Spirochaetota bacterium]|nr:hypothetical protein [Spirochaetota bacterium]